MGHINIKELLYRAPLHTPKYMHTLYIEVPERGVFDVNYVTLR